MEPSPVFIIVSGPAAAGKTTLARPLAKQLDLPWLSKDTIKAAIQDTLDPSLATALAIGQASVAVLVAIAAQMNNRGAVVDCVWRGNQADGLRALPGFQIEVFCRCDRGLLQQRYAARQRPPNYRPEHTTSVDLWSEETMRPIGGRPLIQVDTAVTIDVPALAKEIAGILDVHARR